LWNALLGTTPGTDKVIDASLVVASASAAGCLAAGNLLSNRYGV